jgi:hypothetical protein
MIYTGYDYPDEETDDRDWKEWLSDSLFEPICWTVVACLAIGVSGAFFFVGIWGFVNGIALLR